MKGLPQLESVSIPNHFQFRKLGDFMCQDAPFFSHLADERNEEYLMKWCDQDETFNRWMLFKTDDSLLLRFFEKAISLPDLIRRNPDGFLYFVNADEEIEWRQIVRVKVAGIPAEYLPFESVFYKPRAYEEHARHLHARLARAASRQPKLYSILPQPAAAAVGEPPSPNYKPKP